MRDLEWDEILQRGCEECADCRMFANEAKKQAFRFCTHKACPYHELDNVQFYGAYLKTALPSEKGMIKLLKILSRL